MVGTGAVATKDVEPYHIKVGIPAKTVKLSGSGLVNELRTKTLNYQRALELSAQAAV